MLDHASQPNARNPEPETAALHQTIAALAFAAERHRHQRRKDRQASPYINHPIALAERLLAHGIADSRVLCAAILHDTLEDTRTTPKELSDRFGAAVAGIVEEVTDDKSLPKEERKRLQIEHASGLSAAAKLVKLADKCDNLRDLLESPPADWPPERRLAYFDWAAAVAAGLRGTHPGLEADFDALLARRGEVAAPPSESASAVSATSVCPRCGARFRCNAQTGASAGASACACQSARLTPEQLSALRLAYADCLCLDCLRTLAAAEPGQWN